MYIATKKAIRNNEVVTIRIKSINWNGTRYALEMDGETIATGSLEVIEEKYNNI